MAELGLDQVERSPFLGQLEGVGVPEAVGMDALLDAGALRQPLAQTPDVVRQQWMAFERAEKRCRLGQVEGSTSVDPSIYYRERFRIQPERSTLVSLAM